MEQRQPEPAQAQKKPKQSSRGLEEHQFKVKIETDSDVTATSAEPPAVCRELPLFWNEEDKDVQHHLLGFGSNTVGESGARTFVCERLQEKNENYSQTVKKSEYLSRF